MREGYFENSAYYYKGENIDTILIEMNTVTVSYLPNAQYVSVAMGPYCQICRFLYCFLKIIARWKHLIHTGAFVTEGTPLKACYLGLWSAEC